MGTSDDPQQFTSDAPRQFSPSELLRPTAFAHPVTRLELRETNISWLILTGPFAYKIKKCLRLDFLDQSTLELRHHLCEEELRLNRRLAADLYLDVNGVTRQGGVLRMGGPGRAIEYAVRMKQFDPALELAALLDGAQVTHEEIDGLAERLAEFHASAPSTPREQDFQHTDDLQAAVLGNLAILLSHLDGAPALPDMGLLIDWSHDRLRDSTALLRAREQSGFIRECHGDLHAGNIVRWGGRLVPFDCLEFNPKLRWIDVMNDIAFLVMDLTAHERRDLAWSFLNTYLARSGDYAGVRLLLFYAVYRALVRAMVDSLEAQHVPEHRERALRRLRMRVSTAAEFMHRSPPTLFIMHGPSGSGKSWFSERLAENLGAVRIRSDVERRRLAAAGGVDPRAADSGASGYEQGKYSPEFSRRTYSRLVECAQACLDGSVDAIVDAAFLHAEDRRLFRDLAARCGARLIVLSCTAPPDVLMRRVSERQERRADPSEAGVEVLARQLQHLEPIDPGETAQTITIDTAQPDALQNALGAIARFALPARPTQAPRPARY
jgi:aminoglycoside phosphotransferase family enzyme/predicted kinase